MSITTATARGCAHDHAHSLVDVHVTHAQSHLNGRIQINWVRLYCPRCRVLLGVLITGPCIWPEGTA